MVEQALRRLGEQAVARIAEIGRDDGGRAARRIRDDHPEELESLADLRRGPWQSAGNPIVVDVRPALAEHDVLDPVGARPA